MEKQVAGCGDRVALARTNLLKHMEPDVILLDIGLPDVDGFEVCRLLKARKETAAIPVIHVTASHRDELDRDESRSAGAYDYIPEPFDPDHLLKQVRSALQYRYLQYTAM